MPIYTRVVNDLDEGVPTGEAIDPISTLILEGTLVPKGYEQNKSMSSAQTLTVPGGATVALIQAFTQDLRWRDDGTDASATLGMVLAAGSDFFYVGDLSAITFFEITATAELNVSYYGET